MDFCWTFECDKHHWGNATCGMRTFPGASIVSQEVCNDFLPAKNKYVKPRSPVGGLLLSAPPHCVLRSLPAHSLTPAPWVSPTSRANESRMAGSQELWTLTPRELENHSAQC